MRAAAAKDPVELTLHPSMWEELSKLAKARQVSVGDITRIAIYREISRHKKTAARRPPFQLLDRFRIKGA